MCRKPNAEDSNRSPTSTNRERGCNEQFLYGGAFGLAGVMKTHWSPLVEYASRIVRSRDAAEDVAQEAFVRLWERRARWQASGSLPALLYRIARNLALDAVRRGEAQRRLVGRPQDGQGFEASTPLSLLEEKELILLFDQAIATMPPRRREVFVLARFEGLSYRAISEKMGISPQTVANHMCAALADLRVKLAPYLDDEPSSTDPPENRSN